MAGLITFLLGPVLVVLRLPLFLIMLLLLPIMSGLASIIPISSQVFAVRYLADTEKTEDVCVANRDRSWFGTSRILFWCLVL